MSAVRSIAALALIAGLAAAASAQAPPAPAKPAPPAPPAAPASPAAPAQPAFDVKVLTNPAVHAVVLPMKGSYLQHPDAFGRLSSYLAGHNIKPEGSIFARYFSDPSVGEDNLVWEVGVAVPAGTAAEAPFEAKDIPAALTATHVHQGAMEELGSAWGSMIQWVMANGYQPAGPAMQVFKGDMTSGPPEVEMQIPVQK